MFNGESGMTGAGAYPGDDGGEGDLERLLASEELAISDNGFSLQVSREVARSGGGRKVTLYGAGMLGFGIAAGSLSKAASDSPEFAAWIQSFSAAWSGADWSAAVLGGPYLLALAAVAGGLMVAGLGLVVQDR